MGGLRWAGGRVTQVDAICGTRSRRCRTNAWKSSIRRSMDVGGWHPAGALGARQGSGRGLRPVTPLSHRSHQQGRRLEQNEGSRMRGASSAPCSSLRPVPPVQRWSSDGFAAYVSGLAGAADQALACASEQERCGHAWAAQQRSQLLYWHPECSVTGLRSPAQHAQPLLGRAHAGSAAGSAGGEACLTASPRYARCPCPQARGRRHVSAGGGAGTRVLADGLLSHHVRVMARHGSSSGSIGRRHDGRVCWRRRHERRCSTGVALDACVLLKMLTLQLYDCSACD